MTFDLRTTYAMIALACFVLGLLQAAVFLSGRFDRWLAWWSASNILLGVANLCIGLRGHAPDFVTVQIGNLLTIAGCVLMPAAMRLFAGRRIYPIHLMALVVILSLPMFTVFHAAEDARERVIYGSLIACLLDLAVAYEASRLAESEKLYTARLTAALFLTTAMVYIFRAIFGASGTFGTQGLFEGGSGNHALMGLLAMVFLVLRGMMIVLMAAERSANQLRMAAHHDALTGVLNRAGLLHTLANGPQERVSLLLVDLDHFKHLNDTGGHALGDEVLKIFASVATGIVSRNDLVARYGGDEFIVLLRRRDAGEARAVAEQLRRSFAQEVKNIEAELSVTPTLSIGVALEADRGKPLEVLLQRADHALYRVKRGGRDGVEIYDPDVENVSGHSDAAGRARHHPTQDGRTMPLALPVPSVGNL